MWLACAKAKKSTKNRNYFVYFKFLLYLCKRLAAADCFAHANITYYYWRTNQREYKVWQLFILRNKIGKRQCILRYVLLLLYYSWVMPDTHSLIKHKQYFFCMLLWDKIWSLKYWITVKSAKNTLKGEKTPPFLPKNLHISIKCSTFAAEMVAKQPPFKQHLLNL